MVGEIRRGKVSCLIYYRVGDKRHRRASEPKISPKFGLMSEDWEIVGLDEEDVKSI